jgi:hypothetical protein
LETKGIPYPEAVPWTFHSPNATLGGPIKIPIPKNCFALALSNDAGDKKMMNRRSFIYATTTYAVSVVGFLGCTRTVDHEISNEEIDSFLDKYRTRNHKKVAESFFEQNEHELSWEKEFESLFGDYRGQGELGTFLLNKMNSEYRSGDVVYIDGWIYSASEIRLYIINFF